jgi:hypothetical protein
MAILLPTFKENNMDTSILFTAMLNDSICPNSYRGHMNKRI